MSGEFKTIIYKHIGSLFLPLRLTEYIEYQLLFRLSGYFCFLEQKFRKENCKFFDFMQSPILVYFKNIIYIHIGSLFIPLRLTEIIEYQLLFRFSGYFCFLVEKFSKGKCKLILFMKSTMSEEFKSIIYKHIGSLFIPLRLTEYIEYQLLFRFSGYFCFLEKKFRRRNCKFFDFMQSPIFGEFKNITYIHIESLFIPLRLTDFKEHQLLFLFSGYFCFLEEKFRKVKCKLIAFM